MKLSPWIWLRTQRRPTCSLSLTPLCHLHEIILHIGKGLGFEILSFRKHLREHIAPKGRVTTRNVDEQCGQIRIVHQIQHHSGCHLIRNALFRRLTQYLAKVMVSTESLDLPSCNCSFQGLRIRNFKLNLSNAWHLSTMGWSVFWAADTFRLEPGREKAHHERAKLCECSTMHNASNTCRRYGHNCTEHFQKVPNGILSKISFFTCNTVPR
jgi:hypothetical protein